MSYFGETIIFTGQIYNNGNIVKNVRCELTLDQRNTNKNNIKIFYPDKDSKKIDKITKINPIFIKSDMYGRKIFVKSFFVMHRIISVSEPFVLLTANKIVIDDNYSNKNPQKCFFSFHLTKSNILRRKNVITTHASKGLLSGWKVLIEDKLDHEGPEWEEEEFILPFPFDKSYIIPGFVFEKFNDDDSYKVYNQLYLTVLFNHASDKNIDLLENEVIRYIDSLLKILSFIEGNYIRWFFATVTLQGKSYVPILERKIFSKVKLPMKKLPDEMYYLRNTEKYKKIIPKIFIKYHELGEGKRKIIDKILDRFMVSTTHDKIDTRIIYWHSCLDLMINILNKQKGNNFSEQLILLCEQYDIEWKDLFPYVDKANLSSKEKGFLINIIRTEIIHKGEYPNDYKIVFYELYKVRALCERLILKYLGIDYRNTPLGIPHLEQTQ